jgi:hypothetical protein
MATQILLRNLRRKELEHLTLASAAADLPPDETNQRSALHNLAVAGRIHKILTQIKDGQSELWYH